MNSDLVRFSKPPTGNFEFISDGLNTLFIKMDRSKKCLKIIT